VIQAALEDLKVLDLTHYIAGPFCTKLLADYGADVVKIERPGAGDGARWLGPFPGDVADPERSGLFLHLNTNKRSVVLDLKAPEGIRLLRQMVAGTDVLVENFHPRVMPGLGLSYAALAAINPRLVMLSISDFGQTGPYRGYRGSEIVDYALGGAMYSAGLPDRFPLKLGGSVVSYLAGAHAAAATVVAILGTALWGEGDHVDIAIMQTQAGSPDRRAPMLVGYQYTGQVNRRGMGLPPPVRPCRDGYMNMQFGLAWVDRLLEMLGRPELKDDPRFTDPVEAAKPENAELLEGLYLAWLGERTMQEAWAEAQRARVLSGPLYSVAQLLADRHFRERGYWEPIDHPTAGRWRYPGLPFATFGAPREPRRPAPRLGEHTDQVLRELGLESDQIDRLRRAGVIE
jgi:crotonobetainyl-CoA:carnitine CoA-transferase CaiB-like acyl-CoA transferase